MTVELFWDGSTQAFEVIVAESGREWRGSISCLDWQDEREALRRVCNRALDHLGRVCFGDAPHHYPERMAQGSEVLLDDGTLLRLMSPGYLLSVGDCSRVARSLPKEVQCGSTSSGSREPRSRRAR